MGAHVAVEESKDINEISEKVRVKDMFLESGGVF